MVLVMKFDIEKQSSERPVHAVLNDMQQQLKKTTRRLQWVSFSCLALITFAPFAGVWLANSGH
jgi:uncharacterized membrane protein